MAAVLSELDKSFTAVADDHGTMSIRIVVVKKRDDADAADEDTLEVPADLGDDEVIATSGKTPVTNYLEDPKRGHECCVFLINGQRQDAWDNTFIVRDLGKKYLRNRTVIIVTLDGLKPEATAELMSGDRQGFFQGDVYHALSKRLIATLKKDPDLERLEEDAEREISELRAGDEAVKEALDQLIDDHHAQADHAHAGKQDAGADAKGAKGFGKDRSQLVVTEPQNAGYVTPDPYLVASHATGVVRLHPDESTTVKVTSAPADQWNKVGPPQVLVTPPVDGLKADVNRDDSGLSIELQFEEPEDWEDDQYPVEAMLRVVALIDGYKEPRVVERRLVVSKPKKRKPRPPAVLLDDPTFIRVTSRQPVALIPGGADAHVRLRWNGKDELAVGTPPLWSFSARCVTLPSFPPLTFSKPSGGRFELLVQVPPTIAPGQQLTFDVEASGPGGKVLKTSFTAQAAAIVTPQGRTLKKVVAEPSSQRKPPYRLVYVDKSQWDKGYWTDDGSWTPEDAGCFHDPTESSPLTLIINEDYGLLSSYRESLTTKKLEPATVKERVTRYTSHVAFHLYQMYMNYKRDQEAQAKDESIKPATPEQMRGEINRVAATLLKMMNISR